MSDSVRPHRWQPTRLRHPWDSPGKNTGVGCHFLLQCMKVKSEREVTQSCRTLCDPMDCSSPGSSVHGILQGRILEWVATSFSRGSSQPRDQTQVSRVADGFFYRLSPKDIYMYVYTYIYHLQINPTLFRPLRAGQEHTTIFDQTSRWNSNRRLTDRLSELNWPLQLSMFHRHIFYRKENSSN